MDDSQFIQVKIQNISLSNIGFVVFLKSEVDEKNLPICVGAAEVNSISEAISESKLPRPSSHNLFKDILNGIGYVVEKIHVTKLIDDTYYARVYLKNGSQTIDFDARPSDAISMALRFQAPIFVHKDLFQDQQSLPDKNNKEEETKSSPLEILKQKLTKAVDEERYEDAIKLKEKISQLEIDDMMNN